MAEPANAEKVDLRGAPATMLVTLYAKALDFRSPHPILNDERAAQIVGLIDYDFERVTGFGDSVMMAIRARQYDEWLQEFLAGHRDAVVLNLGCGLDTRVSRIDPPASVQWFDVDFPAVIDLRKRFYTDSGTYTMLAASLSEERWLDQVARDRPAAIVAEGVFEYMDVEDVKALLNRLTTHFAEGQVIFDCLSSLAVKAGRTQLETKTGAVHRWAVDDIRDVDALEPRLRRIDDLSLLKTPFRRQLSWRYRLLFAAAARVPRFRDLHRLLRYEFSPAANTPAGRTG
jgi:O-methyltransferase involved in polyketide biosynthesis